MLYAKIGKEYEMKVVVAIDSLKGSLTSMEAGKAIKEGILIADPAAEVIVKPLADGGEGTTEALVSGLGGELVSVEVQGPLEEKVTAAYGIISETKTAIIEMAAAAGIILAGNDKRPLDATTYGVGEMIQDAIGRGCRNFIVGIGGSATNDVGVGMLQALGFSFLDSDGREVPRGAKALSQIEAIDDSGVIGELSECSFNIACDVVNPLFGENGATYIYGPQKGVSNMLKPVLDEAVREFGKKTAKHIGQDFTNSEGAGAAGGMGFAFLSYLNGKLSPGIDLVLDAVKLDESMKGADYVITGEGRLDHQTAMGKGPVGVAKMGKSHGAVTIALAGSIAPGAKQCNDAGIDAFFPILTSVITLEEAMKPEVAARNMQDTAEQIFRLLKADKGR